MELLHNRQHFWLKVDKIRTERSVILSLQCFHRKFWPQRGNLSNHSYFWCNCGCNNRRHSNTFKKINQPFQALYWKMAEHTLKILRCINCSIFKVWPLKFPNITNGRSTVLLKYFEVNQLRFSATIETNCYDKNLREI